MKPRLLPAIVTLLCAFNLAGYLLIEPNSGAVGAQILFITVIVLVSFVAIWRFWFGSRLSRILVIITSALAILNLLFLPSMNTIQRSIVIGEALLAAFLFYWLFTPGVRQYFASGPKI
jgi:hypothetical protein